MLLLIDGPDCTRKSSLAQRLLEHLATAYPGDRVHLIHRGPPKGHPLDEYVVPLLRYRPGTGQHIICDRWHWGERAYPVATGRPTLLDDAVWHYVEAFLNSRGAVVIYQDLPDDVIRDCVRIRGDRLYDESTILRAAAEFRHISHTRTSLPVVVPTQIDLDEIVNFAVRVAAERDESSQHLNELVTYVGPPTPRYLVLGDVRVGGPSSGLRPAFMPYRATSGHYLLSHITPDVITDCGFANACDVDSPSRLVHTLRPKHVLTLGANATHRVRRVTSIQPVGAVPHPQYWRRFFNHHGSEYGKLITEAFTLRADLRSRRPVGTWLDEQRETPT